MYPLMKGCCLFIYALIIYWLALNDAIVSYLFFYWVVFYRRSLLIVSVVEQYLVTYGPEMYLLQLSICCPAKLEKGHRWAVVYIFVDHFHTRQHSEPMYFSYPVLFGLLYCLIVHYFPFILYSKVKPFLYTLLCGIVENYPLSVDIHIHSSFFHRWVSMFPTGMCLPVGSYLTVSIPVIYWPYICQLLNYPVMYHPFFCSLVMNEPGSCSLIIYNSSPIMFHLLIPRPVNPVNNPVIDRPVNRWPVMFRPGFYCPEFDRLYHMYRPENRFIIYLMDLIWQIIFRLRL